MLGEEEKEYKKEYKKEDICDKPSVFGLVKGYVSKHKLLFAAYILTLLLFPLQDIGMPHFIGKLTQAIRDKKHIINSVFIVVGLISVIQLGNIFIELLDTRLLPSIQSYIRDQLLKRIIAQNSTNYETLQMGKILMRISRLPFAIYGFITEFKRVFLPNIIVYIFAAVYISRHDMLLGAGLVILILLLGYSLYYTVNTCSAISKNRDKLYNNLNEQVDDVLMNLVSVLNMNKQDQELKLLELENEKFGMATRQSISCTNKTRFIFIPLILSYFVLFNWRLYKKVVSGEMHPEVYIPILLIFLYIMNTMWGTLSNVSDLVMRTGMIRESLHTFDVCGMKALNTLQNLNESENKGIGPVSIKGTIPLTPSVIQMKNVDYKYNNKVLLANFSISFNTGQRTLLVGTIGSGKSTIVKLILKYYEPAAGEIYYHEIPYSSLTTGDIRSRIAYIPQNPMLFDRTLYENIVYGSEHISKQDVNDLHWLYKYDCDIVKQAIKDACKAYKNFFNKVSVKYLQNYVNEFCFRYNNRKNNMFDMVLEQGILVK
jgi:ABC-type multidrug transport system fused ATPase/permease subunit